MPINKIDIDTGEVIPGPQERPEISETPGYQPDLAPVVPDGHLIEREQRRQNEILRRIIENQEPKNLPN